jgi:type I restriction enzyme S subunit
MQLRRTVSLTIGGVWGDEPDGIDDLAVVRVADFDMESLTAGRVVPTQRRIDPGQRGRRLLREGDLLLEKSGGGEKQNVGRVVQWTGEDAAVCSNFVNVLRPTDRCDSRYLAYLHRSLYGLGWPNACTKQTTGIQNLDVGAYLHVAVPRLGRDAQRRIATFLDRECARANEVLRQHQAVHSAVLSSLWSPIDDLVRSAPTQRLKFWLRGIVDAEHATCPTFTDGTVPVVRTSDVRDGALRLDGALRTDEAGWRQWTRRRVPQTGDVVFTREAPIGEAAVVPPDKRLCIGQRSVLLLINREKVLPDLVVACLYSSPVRAEIELRGQLQLKRPG